MNQTDNEPSSPQLRLRVFAGPNGSGKSTIIKSIRESKANGHEIDFGVYINADDITKSLKENTFSFTDYEIETTKDSILAFSVSSGLLRDGFSVAHLSEQFSIKGQKLTLISHNFIDITSQILARFLREALLKARKRYSFETVFSHESNIEDMKKAVEAGYKVYLYFVSTESPEINKYRVALRVKQNGHPVPADVIVKRYYRSLELLYDAASIAYQAYFFDNSGNDEPYKVVGHFKMKEKEQIWDLVEEGDTAKWFEKYYLSKLTKDGKAGPSKADSTIL